MVLGSICTRAQRQAQIQRMRASASALLLDSPCKPPQHPEPFEAGPGACTPKKEVEDVTKKKWMPLRPRRDGLAQLLVLDQNLGFFGSRKP